jgi:hypothetical protein
MMTNTDVLFTGPVMAGLGVLLVIELGLMIWGVVDWSKRPAELIRGNRILWLLVILLLNIVGPILYLTVGRLPAVSDVVTTGSTESMQAAADSLYGSSREDIIS